jgi:hypothetical protein
MNEEKVTQKVEPAQAEYDETWRKVGKQAESLADTLASALKMTWEKASHEAQPHLLSLLHQVQDEVQKMINRLEQPEPVSPPEPAPDQKEQEL